jgi:hypothetical protein
LENYERVTGYSEVTFGDWITSFLPTIQGLLYELVWDEYPAYPERHRWKLACREKKLRGPLAERDSRFRSPSLKTKT